ncbi:MAG: heavy metal-associated domain-containing protein [Bacteroidota bacterium]|nr:heavy metal-associated domain-containing protein [Bacteroidota bacterium]
MKTLKITLQLALLLTLNLSCKEKPTPKIILVKTAASQSNNKSSKTETNNATSARFTIKGMSCEIGCARAIEKKLYKLDGIYKADVNFQKEMATVKYDSNKIDEALLISTITSGSQTSNYSVEEFKINTITSKIGQ